MARPGKHVRWLTKEGLTLIEGWARNGLSEKQIAKNMGISYSTFRVWRDKFPALSAALKKNKEIVDMEIENALYKAAISGNIAAQIFWLKNRRPDKWREKPVDVSNNDTEITVRWDGGEEYGV